MELHEIKQDLKINIIKELNLEDITPEDILDDAPLFGEGLGLDSIDALELIVIMEKNYGVKVPSEEVGRQVLTSVQTMAEYILIENNIES
jgi:acyl carrier protein